MKTHVNPEEIKHVAMFFKQFGNQLGVDKYLITGGYPRDVALGRKPKDIDVLVNSNLCIEELIHEVNQIANQKLHQVEFIVYENYDDSCNHFSENYVVGLHIAVKDMLPIDLLFIKETKISSIINSFDCSLNKGIVTEDNKIIGLEIDKFEYIGTCPKRFRRFVDMYTSLLEKESQVPTVIPHNIFGE